MTLDAINMAINAHLAALAAGYVEEEKFAGSLLIALRENGAWLPGDPITNTMIDAGACAIQQRRGLVNAPGIQVGRESEAAITAALAVLGKP